VSSVCLFVTFLHPTQPVNILGHCVYVILYPSHPPTPMQKLTEIVLWKPLYRRLNAREVAKYSDVGPFEGYVLKTVQDMATCTIND